MLIQYGINYHVTDIFMVLMSKPSLHDMAIYTSKCTAIENHILAIPIWMIKKEIITSTSIFVLYMHGLSSTSSFPNNTTRVQLKQRGQMDDKSVKEMCMHGVFGMGGQGEVDTRNVRWGQLNPCIRKSFYHKKCGDVALQLYPCMCTIPYGTFQ